MRCTRAAFQRFIFAAALWAAVVVSGQELSRTQISDTLFNADGSRAEGSLNISWRSFTAADGSTVPRNSISVDVVDGVVALSLAPNEGAAPEGTSYQVRYRLRGSRPFAELWVVPESGEAVTVSDIRVEGIPPVGTSVAMSQVSGLPSALDGKADRSGPNTFVAPQVLREDSPGSTNPLLGFQKNSGTAGVYFRLPPLSGDVTYTLPPSDGAPNQALTTDGSGSLFWSSAAGGGAGSGSAYEVLQQGGSSLTQRTVANFTSGFVLSDNGGQLRTDITPNFGTGAGKITEGNDARLSDARTPLTHASTHATAGGDAITPLSIGALGRTNDFMVGANSTVAVLKVQGASGQTAALQEWRDGTGSLAALVTAGGTGFFREMGVAAPTGRTTASQFFEIGGLKKFALSATDGVLDVLRYDNGGVFLDRPLRVFRNGNIETAVSMNIADATVGSGTLGLTGDYLELESVSAPGTPAAGFGRLFLDSSNGEVSIKKSSGATISLAQGGDGASDISDLSDVDTTGVAHGEALLFDGVGDNRFEPGVVATPTNSIELVNKTIDGGAPRTGVTALPSGANEIFMLRHEDDCTALSGPGDGAFCFEEDSNRIYVCGSPEGIAGVCDAAGEWTVAGGGESLDSVIGSTVTNASAVCDGSATAAEFATITIPPGTLVAGDWIEWTVLIDADVSSGTVPDGRLEIGATSVTTLTDINEGLQNFGHLFVVSNTEITYWDQTLTDNNGSASGHDAVTVSDLSTSALTLEVWEDNCAPGDSFVVRLSTARLKGKS